MQQQRLLLLWRGWNRKRRSVDFEERKRREGKTNTTQNALFQLAAEEEEEERENDRAVAKGKWWSGRDGDEWRCCNIDPSVTHVLGTGTELLNKSNLYSGNCN